MSFITDGKEPLEPAMSASLLSGAQPRLHFPADKAAAEASLGGTLLAALQNILVFSKDMKKCRDLPVWCHMGG